MTSHKLVRYLCILVLLFAQQAAYTHAAWHASDQGNRQDQHDASFQDKLCGLHGAFCEVLGALSGTVAVAPVAPIAQACPPGPLATRIVLPPRIARSRGPPYLS